MPVQYEKRGPIGIVTLSRPGARNAWGADFNEGIAGHFAAMEDDDEIRCAVLTGDEAGGAFSAGANLKDPKTHTMASAAEFIKGSPKRRDRAFELLGNFPKPPVGAANVVAGPTSHGQDARGGRTPPVIATAGRAPGQGVAAPRPRRSQPRRRLAGRSLSVRDPRADGGQGRGARGVAREAQANIPGPLSFGLSPAF